MCFLNVALPALLYVRLLVPFHPFLAHRLKTPRNKEYHRQAQGILSMYDDETAIAPRFAAAEVSTLG